MNIQDTPRSLANAVSNIMAGHSIEKIELTEAKETTVPFEKMNILTPDQWDQVQNFKNFNEKEWKWNAIQKKFVRKVKVKESTDVEESNEFTAAAAKAKLAGKDEFEFDGKTYPVEIEQDAAEKILGKKESVEIEEASNADLKKVLATAKKLGADVKGNTADFGQGAVTDFSIEKGKIKFDGGMSSGVEYFKNVKDAISALMTGVDESIEEAVKWWTVTITKKAGKLFKGQTVDVKANNSAEAIKKGLKQMKVDNPMTVPSGSVDAVLAESLKEAIKPSNGKSTIGLQVMEPERALKDMKKFKLKGKEGKGRNSDEVVVTGKNTDIFKYLRSAYYGLDADEIEEFYPELFESVDLEEAIKPSNGKSTVGLEVMEPAKALKDMKKFKLKGKQGRGDNENEIIVTGKNVDIFKYLKSKAYGLDADEIEDFYPELFESVDLEESVNENRAVVHNPRGIKAFIRQAEKKFPQYKGEIEQLEDDEIVFPDDEKLKKFFKGAREVKFVLTR